MQIVEVKNDIAKISYNSANNHLLPSDFVLIEDNTFKFIAQVINIQTTDDSVLNNATLRLCLSIDSEDNLSYYNGYIISKNAKVNYISSTEIIDLISDEKGNVYFGNLSNHPDIYVKTNSNFVDEKLYIQSDKSEKTSIIVKNLVSQLVSADKKVLILDFDNQYSNIENSVTLKIGENIKLPLNVMALDNILEKDIEDCLLEDKALIQSIILELREYIQTLPERFLKFSLFRDVVNAQYQENQVSGLMVLRNKLWLYAQNNFFANDINEFMILNEKISESNCIVVDASSVSEKWQNVLAQIIKDIIIEQCYFIVNLDGVDANKKMINDIYAKENIIPIFCSSYSNSCRPILSLLSKNQVLCKPSSYIDENVQYVDFLNKLSYEEFILFGESTLYLPLLLSIQQFDSNTMNSVVENDIKREVDKLLCGGVPVVQTPEEEERNEVIENSVLCVEEEKIENDYLVVEENQEVENISGIDSSFNDDEVLDDDLDFLDELDEDNQIIQNQHAEETPVEILEDEPLDELIDEEFDQIDEIENVDLEEEQDVVLEENSEEAFEEEEIELQDDKDDEGIETTDIADVFDEEESYSTEEENEQDDYEQIEIDENIVVNEEQNIPIYETDVQEKLNQDDIPFKVGDKVFHPKHGNGIVQGFTNYSDKILFCQIEFENVGRRILDPRVAQIEKV